DINGAVESHMTILKLVRRMSDEPSLVIGFLVQGSIYMTAYNGLQQVLSDADPSLQSYRSLIAELKSWDIDRDFVRALQSERVYTFVVCDWMQRKASKKMLHRLFASEQPFKVNLAVLLKPRSVLIAQNCLKMVNYQNEVIAIARKGAPYDQEAIRQLEERWQSEVENTVKSVNLSGLELVWDEKAIAKMLVPAFSNFFQKANYYHAMQRIAQTAIALRLYWHEHGRYPENLSQLVPKFLSSVPIDPFDGKPIRYKRLKQGFKIWSVGENLKDDGGVESKGAVRREKGDILWEAMK
ncbi:MAG: hypothetical protein NZ937_00680, partial [Armatimonadetes bacterium]|nr:hypothetical protein [Armatimonadota bacterium]